MSLETVPDTLIEYLARKAAFRPPRIDDARVGKVLKVALLYELSHWDDWKRALERVEIVKLIGSKTEDDFRRELISGSKFFSENARGRNVLERIRMEFPNVRSAYILNWIPEQGEEIIDVLVDDDIVVHLEVPHTFKQLTEIVLSRVTLYRYERSLSKSSQIKLAVALELARASF